MTKKFACFFLRHGVLAVQPVNRMYATVQVALNWHRTYNNNHPWLSSLFVISGRFYGLTINRNGPGQKWLIISLRRLLWVELKGVRRANYPQLTKGMNSSQLSWWVSFQVGMDVFNVSCLFSWTQALGVQGKYRHMRAKYFSTSKARLRSGTGRVFFYRHPP